ncbi:MAG: SufS family cysteine desulfurase [Planctomycetota bacterium]|jgi:cysteine desulfurase/selenocysteine lyase
MTRTPTPSSTAPPSAAGPALDAEQLRRDFPTLHQQVNGHPLVYLDNAATTQKPQVVIDAICQYYETINANIHRGVHHLSVAATEAYERTRSKVQRFIGAERPEEIIFVRSATEAINLAAQAYGRTTLQPGDEIVISHMEHHSNIVPWQLVCEQTGAVLRVAPINDDGELVLEDFEKLLGPRTKFVAVGHVSNALGTVNPIREITDMAHGRGIRVLIDGAQAAPHLPLDMQELDCDFYAISGHKMFGPTGVGVLYGKYDLLEAMPPYQGGGDMILNVTFEKTDYNKLPHKFEAGTPNISGVVGYGATIDYLSRIGMDKIDAYERALLEYGTEAITSIPEVRLIGTAKHRASVISFIIDGVHAHDVGTILDQQGVAIRTGHHCAQPVMQRFGIPATCRASVALYNTRDDIDALVAGIRQCVEIFGTGT